MVFIFMLCFFFRRFVTGRDARTKACLVSRIAEVLDVLVTYGASSPTSAQMFAQAAGYTLY